MIDLAVAMPPEARIAGMLSQLVSRMVWLAATLKLAEASSTIFRTSLPARRVCFRPAAWPIDSHRKRQLLRWRSRRCRRLLCQPRRR
jgi:hypothetical protein